MAVPSTNAPGVPLNEMAEALPKLASPVVHIVAPAPPISAKPENVLIVVDDCCVRSIVPPVLARRIVVVPPVSVPVSRVTDDPVKAMIMPLVMLIGLAIESVVAASLLMREDESIAKIVPVPKAEEFL